jgi:hypothetical protein
LQRLFHTDFPEFAALYETHHARRLGHSRLPRITRAVERFLECGDYTKGVARIRCTDPDCRAEYFRACMLGFFLKHQLINDRLARNMLQCDHCGFSLDYANRNLGEVFPTLAT